MFLELHDADTGEPVYIRADSVQMVNTDADNRATAVLMSSGCSAWVQETPESVIGLIMQEEEK